MTKIPFVKMHGLGNDFVVFDARGRAQHSKHETETAIHPGALPASLVRLIADRRLGIGCDQVIVIESPTHREADAFMRILNADGSEVAACGNATRCIASVLMAETGSPHTRIETHAGLLQADQAPSRPALETGGLPVPWVSVNMGPARLDWGDIPLAEEMDTLHLPLNAGPLQDGVGVGMGNPHAVFVVEQAESLDLARWGPEVETHPLFPERTNVEIIQPLAPGLDGRDRLRLRVWERGAGITRACGTGACAALVAAHRRGLSDRKAEILLDGGPLDLEWLGDGTVLMSGPVATSFRGTLEGALRDAWLAAQPVMALGEKAAQ